MNASRRAGKSGRRRFLAAPVTASVRIFLASALTAAIIAAAIQSVVRARPDGHTLLTGFQVLATVKDVVPNLGFEPLMDFVPITGISRTSGGVLVVRSDSTLMRVEDLVAQAKANPGKLSYASGGIGDPAHLASATLLAVTGTSALHVPYKGGGAPGIAAILGGDVDFSITGMSFVLPQLKSGKLRALGIASETRRRELPDVPTLHESFKSALLMQEGWAGLFAPVKTPDEVIKKLHAATIKALGGTTLQRAIESAGATASPSRSPEEFAAFFRREYNKWGEIVKRSGIKAE